MTSNLEATMKTALMSLTDDTRIIRQGMVVEQSLVTKFTKVCGQPIDGIAEPIQCTESPPTFEFTETLYLPHNANVREFGTVIEEALNGITSYQDGAFHMTSCSLSDASVVSLAKYYPDWFGSKSCTNDGKCLQCAHVFHCKRSLTMTLLLAKQQADNHNICGINLLDFCLTKWRTAVKPVSKAIQVEFGKRRAFVSNTILMTLSCNRFLLGFNMWCGN